MPQSKEENGSEGTRKHHLRLDSRLHRRIVSAATHFFRSGGKSSIPACANLSSGMISLRLGCWCGAGKQIGQGNVGKELDEGLNLAPPKEGFELYRHKNA